MENEKRKNKILLTGTCACPGEVEGKITKYNPNRVYNKKDVVILNEHMTQDVMRLKEAGAILSKNGGLTCHASILARELNIPCIVGVKGLDNTKENSTVRLDAAEEIIVIDEEEN
jgi:pyruvate, water dikinase